MAITIFTQTHRAACLDAAMITSDDAAAYNATIGRFYQELQQLAQADGITLTLDDDQSTYSYLAETDAEHAWYQQTLPFWDWYQAGNDY